MKLFGYTITITKTKKKTGYSRRNWTESETNSLLRFRNEGKSWEEISKLMNRSYAAVAARYSKIHRGVDNDM